MKKIQFFCFVLAASMLLCVGTLCAKDKNTAAFNPPAEKNTPTVTGNPRMEMAEFRKLCMLYRAKNDDDSLREVVAKANRMLDLEESDLMREINELKVRSSSKKFAKKRKSDMKKAENRLAIYKKNRQQRFNSLMTRELGSFWQRAYQKMQHDEATPAPAPAAKKQKATK
ncbi:MAG: hypothetical protein PHS41_00400 [Victivallaceae bacterium]|nr:hypothetical protein [Victivallaceae bacterium]